MNKQTAETVIVDVSETTRQDLCSWYKHQVAYRKFMENYEAKMKSFKVEKVLHGMEVEVTPATRTFETKVFVSQRFRPKKFKTEVIIFPSVNNNESPDLSDLRFFHNYAYFIKGLGKRELVLNEAYYVQGEMKKKCHQTMRLQPVNGMPRFSIDQNNNEMPKCGITLGD